VLGASEPSRPRRVEKAAANTAPAPALALLFYGGSHTHTLMVIPFFLALCCPLCPYSRSILFTGLCENCGNSSQRLQALETRVRLLLLFAAFWYHFVEHGKEQCPLLLAEPVVKVRKFNQLVFF
jgi:hypothetical protein